MNFLLTILALTCSISALPVSGMNLNWLRSSRQKFTHYENLVAQTKAELGRTTSFIKKGKLIARIIEKTGKQIKYAPNPEIAKQLSDYVQFRKQFQQLDNEFGRITQKFNNIPVFKQTNQQLVAAKNVRSTWTKATQEAKSETPNLKIMEEFREALKVLDGSMVGS